MEAIDFIEINQLGAIAFAVNPCAASISAARAARSAAGDGRAEASEWAVSPIVRRSQ